MKYDAITIDTQTVEHNGFNFDGGLLGQLKQFSNGPIDVIISQIVLAEINAHLRSKMQAAKDSVESAHKKAIQYGLKPPSMSAFDSAPDIKSLSKTVLATYITAIGATIIAVDEVAVKDLVRMYFQAAPPFSKSKEKKSEFPDAIALLSMERWAKDNKKKILAVSNDGDWETFAAGSAHIDVVKDLADALAKLQEHGKEADALATELLSNVASGGMPNLTAEFEKKLDDAISNSQFDGDAESEFRFETEQVDATLNRSEFPIGDSLRFRVVQSGPQRLVVDVDLLVYLNAEASFSFYVWDSVDHENMLMGSTTARKENDPVEITALVTFEGNFDEKSVSITAVEIVNQPISIDFGHVRPAFSDDRDYEYDPTHNSGDPFPDEF
jgi:hypothetical protein